MTRAQHFRQAMIALAKAAEELVAAQAHLIAIGLHYEMPTGRNIQDALSAVRELRRVLPARGCDACPHGHMVQLQDHVDFCDWWKAEAI